MSRPVVSIIIRTMGRASLARSVDCALAQSWRPLEIAIVRAGGDSLPAFASDSDVPIRVLDRGPLNRPQAANAGLAEAHGEWLVFLDDDDEILPTHVETLMDLVLDSGNALVAYSATLCLDADGRPSRVLDEPFDRRALFVRNYIQLGAALFSRQLVQEGYRFDESFERLQDWDFWMQLATRTHFAASRQRTNLWWMESGESGTGGGGNRDSEGVGPYLEMFDGKWRPSFAALDRKLEHHRKAVHAATERNDEAGVTSHMEAVDRLLRGPVSGMRARGARVDDLARTTISRSGKP
ncbi:MAG TPA: glycosyltransferase family A protein [Usitatibacter sp.]|nr:glycosyltransferase family A protein [Usitatibacter sp.]